MGHKFELLFVGEKKPDWFSWLIQYGQSRMHGAPVNFSHVAILVDDSRVFDSTGRGFLESSLADLLKGDSSVVRHRYELFVPDVLQDGALAWLRGRRGIGYARLQCLGVVFPILRRIPFIRNGFKRAFCSESGADFLFEWCVHSGASGLVAAGRGSNDPRLLDRDWVDPYSLKLIAQDYGFEVLV